MDAGAGADGDVDAADVVDAVDTDVIRDRCGVEVDNKVEDEHGGASASA